MKITKFILFIACFWPSYLLAEHSFTQNNNAHTNAKANSEFEKEINSLLNSLHTITRVPGFSVAVVHRGETVTSVATGLTNIESKYKDKRAEYF